MSGQMAPRPAVSWRRRILLGVVVWFALCAGGFLLRAHPRPALLALAVAATGATLLLFLDLADTTPSAGWTLRSVEPVRPPGEDARLALLVRLVNGHLVAREAGNQLREHLLAIIDQRLVAHHGVSRVADPERAVGLMPPELAAFVTAPPPYRRMSLTEISRLADQIEEL